MVNFFVVGAMKCGMTSMYCVLDRHEDIFISGSDAENYFNSEYYEKKSIKSFENQFEGASGKKCVGKMGGHLAWDSFCRETSFRIHKNFPDAKIVYLVRHPVDRIISHWAWSIANGKAWGGVNEAVQS
jgi:hypothetical protein